MERIQTYVLTNSNHLVCICVIRKKYYKYFFYIDVGYSFHSFNSLLKKHIHLRNFNFQLSIVNFLREPQQVSHAHGDYSHCAGLSKGIGGKAHYERENRTAKQAHYHQSRNFVLLVGHRCECLGKAYRENVGIAKAGECYCGEQQRFGFSPKKSAH